jgi:hypothetical protein
VSRSLLKQPPWHCSMARPLWQLCAEDPSALTCDECFALLEHYAELLAEGGHALIPKVIEHLRRCPECKQQHREALVSLLARCSESSASSAAGMGKPSNGEEEE